jgi:hypothetical protein
MFQATPLGWLRSAEDALAEVLVAMNQNVYSTARKWLRGQQPHDGGRHTRGAALVHMRCSRSTPLHGRTCDRTRQSADHPSLPSLSPALTARWLARHLAPA